MPALISNYLLAERVLSGYRLNGKEKVDEDAFLWGAQGYDFLFSRPTKQFHEKSAQAFEKMRTYKEHPERALNAIRQEVLLNHDEIFSSSYYRGFACNCIFIRTVSPFFNARFQALQAINPEMPEESLKDELTSSLDTILLRYERAELPTEFDLKKAFPVSQKVLDCIAEIYFDVLKNICGISAAKEDVLQAEKAYRSEAGHLNDRTGLKKLFCKKYEKHHPQSHRSCSFRGMMEDGGFDYANILSSPWSWPPEQKEKCTTCFFDLFEEAADEALHAQLKIDTEKSNKQLVKGEKT